MAKRKSSKKSDGKKPPIRKCGQMSMHHELLEKSPGYRRNLMRLEHACARRVMTAVAARTKPFKVKVVVHVLFNRSEENISVSQIKSQITALNKDFRLKNADRSKIPTVFRGLATDAMVEFSLATKDPDDKPTNGITRTPTARRLFPADDSMKKTSSGGRDPWPTNKYLNVWVCRLGNQLLGYAQFPFGPKKTDGVVILNTAFGTNGIANAPFDGGRTTTHEVGHYLNLRHIWGDVDGCGGTDLVSDTPNAETSNVSTPTFPHVSCGNGPNGDMFMNYMDYVDDAAMFMFTQGQVSRMHATLEGPRKNIVS